MKDTEAISAVSTLNSLIPDSLADKIRFEFHTDSFSQQILLAGVKLWDDDTHTEELNEEKLVVYVHSKAVETISLLLQSLQGSKHCFVVPDTTNLTRVGPIREKM